MAPGPYLPTTKRHQSFQPYEAIMKYAFFLLSLLCFSIGWLTFEAEPFAALGFFLAALLAGGLSSIAREVLK